MNRIAPIRRLAAVVAAILLLSGAAAIAQTPTSPTQAQGQRAGGRRGGRGGNFPPGTRPGTKHLSFKEGLPTLWLIGDSTVKEGSDTGMTGGRLGWGHEVDRYFDLSKINVENQALGGTSSRSYYNQNWPGVLAMIQPGDYLMMQLGHNDGGVDSQTPRIAARGTLPGSGDETKEMTVAANNGTTRTETVHTYGWYMRQYAKEARAKGATPIVLSLIPRNDWRDGKVVRGQDNSYVLWAKEAAEKENAFFINLNHISSETMDPMGEEFANGGLYRPDDHTHTIILGAQLNATCVVSGVKALGDALPLGACLAATAEPIEPAKAENVMAGKAEAVAAAPPAQ